MIASCILYIILIYISMYRAVRGVKSFRRGFDRGVAGGIGLGRSL